MGKETSCYQWRSRRNEGKKTNLMMAAYLSKKTMTLTVGKQSPLHVIFGRFTLFQRDDYANLKVLRMHVLS